MRLRRQRIATALRRLRPDSSGGSGNFSGFNNSGGFGGSGSFDNSNGTGIPVSPNCFDSFGRAGIPDSSVSPGSPNNSVSPGSPGGSALRSGAEERIRPDRFRGERTEVAAALLFTMDSEAGQTESGQRQQQYD